MPAKPGIAFVEFETEMQVGGQRAPHCVLRFSGPLRSMKHISSRGMAGTCWTRTCNRRAGCLSVCNYHASRVMAPTPGCGFPRCGLDVRASRPEGPARTAACSTATACSRWQPRPACLPGHKPSLVQASVALTGLQGFKVTPQNAMRITYSKQS